MDIFLVGEVDEDGLRPSDGFEHEEDIGCA